MQITKNHLKEYDAKKITKKVKELFNEYEYQKLILQDYLTRKNSLFPKKGSKGKKHTDEVYSLVLKREKILENIKQFEKKINHVNTKLDEEEKIVLNQSLLKGEKDILVRDSICSDMKKYYAIKKSCYIKIALEFNLIDGITKEIKETISLFN